MTDAHGNPSPAPGTSRTGGTEAATFVVVYQFGKVASSALVAALNAHPGVEAVQSHFLGDAALHDKLAYTLREATNDYFFFHQSRQLLANLDLTRRIGRILAGHDPRTRLVAVTAVRDPLDWLRSALTQDVVGYAPLVEAFRNPAGGPHRSLAEAYAAILDEVATALVWSGGLDALLADRHAGMARLRSEVSHPGLAEICDAALWPLDWHERLFQPVMGCRMVDFRPNGPLRTLRSARLEAHLFRYEDAKASMRALAAELGLTTPLDLPAVNVSTGKPHADEIRAAFASSSASDLARLYSATDYARRYGYVLPPPGGAAAVFDPLPVAAPDPAHATGAEATAATATPPGEPALHNAAVRGLVLCPACQAADLDVAPDGGFTCAECGRVTTVADGVLDLRPSPEADSKLDHTTYDSDHTPDPHRIETLFKMYSGALAASGRGPAGRVLEIGAGAGNLTLGLAVHGRFSDLHVSEISPRFMRRLLARLAEFAPAVPISGYLLDANRLPFADASFDAVLGHSVLHHILDFEATLADARRILRPGGAAVFGEPMMDTHGLVYTLAGQIHGLAETGAGPRLPPEVRDHLRTVAARAAIKGRNLRNRDAATARHEDKFVFPADFLRALSHRTGFARFEMHSGVSTGAYGTLLRGLLGRTLAQAGHDPAVLDPYEPLFAPFTSAWGHGMVGHIVPQFALAVFIR